MKKSKEAFNQPSVLDVTSLKKILSRFNRHAFAKFVYQLCAGNRSRFEGSGWLTEVGEDVFYGAILYSYGGSLHNVWILHFLPEEIIAHPDRIHCEDPDLVMRLRNVAKMYKGRSGYTGYFEPLEKVRQLQNVAVVTNIYGYERSAYVDTIIPGYREMVKKSGLRTPFQLGSYDSFLDLNEEQTRTKILSFLTNNSDGLSIALHPEKPSVSQFSVESPMAVRGDGKPTPVEPVYTESKKAEAILEFESLLKPNISEARIEKFLKANFQYVFGFEYDRIETQLWLKFPELDIAKKNRRLDIFIRNSIFNDWDLYELKRVVPVTGSHRDIPVLTSEVTRAIQQTLYYEKLLNSDIIRRRLAKDGIEYASPSLNLVIGRTPQIENSHWRWLTKNASSSVRILTYDNLLDSMRIRIREREGARQIILGG